jgi:hypothetical protein
MSQTWTPPQANRLDYKQGELRVYRDLEIHLLMLYICQCRHMSVLIAINCHWRVEWNGQHLQVIRCEVMRFCGEC